MFSEQLSPKFFSVSPTNETFALWLKKPFVSDELRNELIQANALMVPEEQFREINGQFFVEGAETLLRFLQDNLEGVKLDICADDTHYQELALHYDVMELGKWVVDHLAAPMLLWGLQKYIEKRRDTKNVEVSVQIVVQKAHDESNNCLMSYRGPANEFHSTLDAALQDTLQTPTISPIPSHTETKPTLPFVVDTSNQENHS